jgi:hypothetical protein
MIIHNMTNVPDVPFTVTAVDGSMGSFFPADPPDGVKRFHNFDAAHIQAYADTWPTGAVVDIDAEGNNSPAGKAAGLDNWLYSKDPDNARLYRWQLWDICQKQRPDCLIGCYQIPGPWRKVATHVWENSQHGESDPLSETIARDRWFEWLGRNQSALIATAYWKYLPNELTYETMTRWSTEAEYLIDSAEMFYGRKPIVMVSLMTKAWEKLDESVIHFQLNYLMERGVDSAIWLKDEVTTLDPYYFTPGLLDTMQYVTDD